MSRCDVVVEGPDECPSVTCGAAAVHEACPQGDAFMVCERHLVDLLRSGVPVNGPDGEPFFDLDE